MRKIILLTVFVVILFSIPSYAISISCDWPQYGGPNRNFCSPETGINKAWLKTNPRVLWTVPLGTGFGGPVIKAGKVYILDRDNSDKGKKRKDILKCIDLLTGKIEWTYSYLAPGKLPHDGSRSVPAIDDKCIYFTGSFGNFVCLDIQKHKPLWAKDLKKEFNVAKLDWGFAQSPSLYKNLVIVAPQGKKTGITAFDKKTGQLIWKTRALKGNPGYVSPVFTTIDKVDQFIMISAMVKLTEENNQLAKTKGEVIGVDTRTGRILWSYTNWQCPYPIPYPMAMGDGKFFITGGYDSGSVIIQVKKKRDKFEVKQIFKTPYYGSQIHQPVFYKGYIYMVSYDNVRRDGFMCLSPDGKAKWKTSKIKGASLFERGSLILADGVILILDGLSGVLRMVRPDPKGYKEIAKWILLKGKKVWAPMALSDGKLLIRDLTQMKCLDISSNKGEQAN